MAYQPQNPIAGVGMSIDTTDPNAPVFNAVPASAGNYLISGGASWSGTGYIYDVSMLTYYLGAFLTSAPTTTTLATADPTFDRFDAIVVDASGTVTNITGTPSMNPIQPTIPDTEVLVQYILVEAGTTQPTVVQDIIYAENVEWATSNYTTTGSPVGSTNFAATNSPYQGSVCIDNLRDQATGDKFVRSATINIQSFNVLSLWVRIPNTIATTAKLSLRFFDASSTPVGNTINLFAYGLTHTASSTWQLAVVPISAFGTASVVKEMRVIMLGNGRGRTVEWDMDLIVLSTGGTPVIGAPSVTQAPGGGHAAKEIPVYTGTNNDVSGYPDFTYDPIAKNLILDVVKQSFFSGTNAGSGATNANNSTFIGNSSGFQATDADHAVFIGDHAGYQAASAAGSTFIGNFAGYQAYNAANSLFVGLNAGRGNTSSGDSIAIGTNSGYLDTNTGTSILLGSGTNAGAFNNVVVIGVGGQATASNQFLISSSTPFTNITLDSTGTVTSKGTVVETNIGSTTYGGTLNYSAGFAGKARAYFNGSHSGSATGLLLPTGTNAVIGTKFTIDDLGGLATTDPITIDAGTSNTITGTGGTAQTFVLNANGESVTLVKLTATQWMIE